MPHEQFSVKLDDEDAIQYGRAQPIENGIIRVLASNPKDYTGTGTNTYIVGGEVVWIIDPGPDCVRHIDAVMQAVSGRSVHGIFVTHTHLDHSPAAKKLSELTGAKTYGFGALSKEILALTDEDVDVEFVPDVSLAHDRKVGEGEWQLQALYTPGHFPNHMCYFLPNKKLLFSGDHVMGWSTTVIMPPLGNLTDYMDSLDLLGECNATLMLPSHGEKVGNPNQRIQEVREHRWMRHRQVRDCLAKGVSNPAEIVEKIYEGLSPRLVKAAKGSVQAHLEVLAEESRLSDEEHSHASQCSQSL